MPQPPGSGGTASQPASVTPAATSADGVLLKVRRLPDAVELVLEDAGQGASLIQRPQGNQWQGELRTSGQRGLRVGPQVLTMPSEGMQRISLDGSGDSFRLTVTPSAGGSLASPVVSSDGRDLVVRFPASPLTVTQTTRPNLNQPTPVPSPAYVPPLRPRAVAPPVGDMAVGTMTMRAPGSINVSGPPVSMIFRNAPSATVLFELAKIGGYGFVAMPDSQTCNLGVGGNQTLGASPAVPASQSTITLAFQNERYSKAVNSALRAAGWGGILEGNTIYAGRSVLCDSFGQQITKVIRLNQADPAAAVGYLATLGALGKRPNIQTTLTTTGLTESGTVSGTSASNQQTTNEEVEIQLFRSPTGPLLGLEASFDRRLGLVTLVGNPNVVAMAEQYLRQYDLRKRQVALAITILDLDLSNNSSLTSSFAYRSGDNFIVNDAGRLFGNLGNTGQQPPFNVPDGDFVGYLQAQITSQTAKILANPTLIMQEGEEVGGSQVGDFSAGGVGSAVRVGASVVTNFNVTTDSNGNIICNPTTTTAGLTMLAKVDKVDDNGFVTFVVAPNISAPVGSQTVPGCGIINILNSRALTTSRVRVRDGQTLILTGVISDEDRAVVTKWPILGDIPIIGSLFRSTGRERTKRELVILVTPRIINDEQGGAYGYGYRPVSDDARQLIYGKGMR
jgi:type IV pilus assembly protein PilQ